MAKNFLLILVLFMSSTSQAQKWTTYDYNSSNYTLGSTNCVAADASGNIWVSAYNSIVKFDQKNSWTIFNSTNSVYPADKAGDLVFDASNTLWVCTYGSGFLSFDGISKWNKYDPTNNTSMPSNYTYCMTFDNSGNAYIGLYSGNSQNAGLVKWNKASTWTPATFFDGYNYKNVEAVAKDKQGNIWCGTAIGVYKYDPVSGTWTSFTKENTNGGLCGNWVRTISVDASGNIWFGSMDKDAGGSWIAGGLSKYNGSAWVNYKPSNSSLSNGNVSAIAFRNTDVWVGTGFCGQFAGNGLYKFDGTVWTNYVLNTSTFPGNCVNDIVLDKNNNLWVAGSNILTKIDFNPTAVESENIPASFKLSQNYPNPFNPSTLIKYSVKEIGLVTLKVYDLLGREMQTLVNEVRNPGYYSVKFDASTLSSGVYYYKMTGSNFADIKKMLLMK